MRKEFVEWLSRSIRGKQRQDPVLSVSYVDDDEGTTLLQIQDVAVIRMPDGTIQIGDKSFAFPNHGVTGTKQNPEFDRNVTIVFSDGGRLKVTRTRVTFKPAGSRRAVELIRRRGK